MRKRNRGWGTLELSSWQLGKLCSLVSAQRPEAQSFAAKRSSKDQPPGTSQPSIQCPGWLLPSRLKRLTPRDCLANAFSFFRGAQASLFGGVNRWLGREGKGIGWAHSLPQIQPYAQALIINFGNLRQRQRPGSADRRFPKMSALGKRRLGGSE